MASPAVATISTQSRPGSHPPQHPVQHQYGTRIRSNSVIKPSTKLRQSPDPPPARRIRPTPITKSKTHSGSLDSSQPDLPVFPPPHIMLHPDDANSKVFIAIGRSFLSVNNSAMTIKDLAEMCMKYGMMCQNASAAGQAITTYIRNHLHRCEVQQDHPLLLRHVLSGTSSDDDLAPALCSRVGGAHCTVNSSESRVTNFRRGTMVWYLSKAAGAPCPFSRAGIRLCDYTEDGKVGVVINPGKERKRERDRLRRAEQCGQKRKRLIRACADKGFSSDSSDEEERPPKVKLTLRLKPSLLSTQGISLSSSPPSPHSESPHYPEIIDISQDPHSDDCSMSADSSDDEQSKPETPWSLPPYPRRSISIPHYTPSTDHSYPAYFPRQESTNRQRSPSLPNSCASDTPPPDSEDEEDDFHISMTGGSHGSPSQLGNFSQLSDDEDYGDTFPDCDPETEQQWGSPGPIGPYTQFNEDATVKHEPLDVHNLLEQWEDFDTTATGTKVLDVVTRAAAGLDGCSTQPVYDSLDLWGWHDDYSHRGDHEFISDQYELPVIVKREDMDPIALPRVFEYSGSPLLYDSPLSPLSACSAAGSPRDATGDTAVDLGRPSELQWQDAELLGPDSVEPHDLEDGEWSDGEAPVNSFHPSKDVQCAVAVNSQCQDPSLPEQCRKSDGPPSENNTIIALADEPISSLRDSPRHRVQDLTSNCPPPGSPPPEVSSDHDDLEGPVVVHTCQPCVPAICATELEGISVYQMTLGSSLILRRIDTDFVKVSPIFDFLGLELPALSFIPHAVDVNQGSYVVCGIWAPVSVVRQIARDQPLVGIFLSDQLNERFPSALQDFHRSNTQGRSLNQFGPHFRSTLEAKRESLSSFRLELPPGDPVPPWDKGMPSPWEVEDHLLSVHPPFALAATARAAPTTTTETAPEMETPLSPTEEEIFRTLCSVTDWEPSAMQASSLVDGSSTAVVPQDRPLRRSKRVANPSTNSRSGTRSSKRGSRSSLS